MDRYKNNIYFNLKDYECRDLLDLISYNKKFDGFHKVKLNWLDKIIRKEHKYGYNRMCPFGIWLLCGVFLPFWILFMFIVNLYTNNRDVVCGISFIICFVIGIVLQVLYDMSCDKIDYNMLMNKNTQINIFEWIEQLN